MTVQTKAERNQIVYGCDIEAFKASAKDSMTYEVMGGMGIITSMLSDTQELIARDYKEQARQEINKIKYLLRDVEFMAASGREVA